MQHNRSQPCHAGGFIREARRPDGWVAPGPQPSGPGERDDLWPRVGEDLCFLSGNFRIFQQQRGHRWSLDDLMVAWCAGRVQRSEAPERILDLGCGIGSVLMMNAWAFERASFVGIEAQLISYELCRRSLAYNGLESRVQLLHADFRTAPDCLRGVTFDLVTGTPPYFKRGRGTMSPLPQRGPCRFELRGGIEAYMQAASLAMKPGADFVVCEDARQLNRVRDAASKCDMQIISSLDVIGREGKPPLFTVFHCRRGNLKGRSHSHSTLIVRDSALQWTQDFVQVRSDMGMPSFNYR